MYKYSVIIPYFKAQNTLTRLLDSIPKRDDIQVIIINDKCRTFDYIKSNFSRNIVLIENDTATKGAGVCRNLGLLYAKGEYLLFADADDYFLNDAFVTFDDLVGQEYDVVYFAPTSIIEGTLNKSTRHLFYKVLIEKHKVTNSNDLKLKFFVPWSKLISSKLVFENDLRFDEIIASNDINFSLEVGLRARRVHASRKSVYCVVDSACSLTKIQTEKVLDSRFYAMCRYNNLLRSNNLKSYQLPMFYYLRSYLKFGYKKSLSKYIEVIKCNFPVFFNLRSFIFKLKYRLYK